MAAHALWQRLSKLPVPLTAARAGWWRAWLTQAGETAMANLALVLRYLNREIDAKRRQPGALRLENLIVKEGQWENDLAFALRAAPRERPAAAAPREQAPVAADLEPARLVNASSFSDLAAKLRGKPSAAK